MSPEPGLQPATGSHFSTPLQALPSVQAASCAVCVQPEPAVQVSNVHDTPSSQLSGAPALHPAVRMLHTSGPLQTLPSSQYESIGVFWQLPGATQESSVQAIPSLQFLGSP